MRMHPILPIDWLNIPVPHGTLLYSSWGETWGECIRKGAGYGKALVTQRTDMQPSGSQPTNPSLYLKICKAKLTTHYAVSSCSICQWDLAMQTLPNNSAQPAGHFHNRWSYFVMLTHVMTFLLNFQMTACPSCYIDIIILHKKQLWCC